ncbi:MAG: hypothetical protein AAGF11_16480 [Myxococcota bacterium]
MAADSLATPITAELQQALWPVEVALEIVAVPDPGRSEPRPGAEPEPIVLMPTDAVTVPDGHRLSLSHAISTPRGRRNFSVDIAARQHPRDQMEIEWDLVVEDAPYQTMSVGDYLLHRLRWGPRPEVDEPIIRVSRADIVTTRGEPHVETLEIDGATYEIRIFALSVRG